MNMFGEELERQLSLVLQSAAGHADRLRQAMAYSAMNGGKRLRPMLVYATGSALGAAPESLHAPACAVELVHCYSLVHDDLPAMDDDDLRRGKPSCHRQFDEATAILAGDALLTLAMQILSDGNYLRQHPERRCQMTHVLANAAADMVQGQALDMAAEQQKPRDFAELSHIYRLKTGAIIGAAVALGSIAASGELAERLRLYADKLGLAFQVRDDVLDATGDTETLGKPGGSDRQQQKTTAVDMLGAEKASETCRQLAAEAVAALDGMGAAADQLREIARFSVDRHH